MEAHQAFTVHSRRLSGRQASKEDAARRQASLDGAIPSREEARLLMSLKRDAREAEQLEKQLQKQKQHRRRIIAGRTTSDDRTDGTCTDNSEEEEEEEEEDDDDELLDEGRGSGSGSGGTKRSARSAAPRSFSTDSQLSLSQQRASRDVSIMKPLYFDRLHEDRDNPLSSLRSCSEFQQGADQMTPPPLPPPLPPPSPP
jgi:hypothetical protein